mgnify:FL=1|tara:strand:+ start:3410 stop:4033 length:624 start_codon:yes stop_codon:yes gene_type:complete
MSRYPRIARGLNKLTPAYWARLMRALKWIEQFGRAAESASNKTSDFDRLPETPAFPAVITGYEVVDIDPMRYRYDWEGLTAHNNQDLFISMGATSSGSYVNGQSKTRLEGKADGTGLGPAYNTTEWGYTANSNDVLPPGFDTSEGHFPGGGSMGTWLVQPIRPRSIVIMYLMPSDISNTYGTLETASSYTNLVPCFCLSNVVIGECA